MCGASGINVAEQGKGERQRWSRKKRWIGNSGRKKVSGKLDPFYHFSTLPDIAKTLYYRAARRCMPEPQGPWTPNDHKLLEQHDSTTSFHSIYLSPRLFGDCSSNWLRKYFSRREQQNSERCCRQSCSAGSSAPSKRYACGQSVCTTILLMSQRMASADTSGGFHNEIDRWTKMVQSQSHSV